MLFYDLEWLTTYVSNIALIFSSLHSRKQDQSLYEMASFNYSCQDLASNGLRTPRLAIIMKANR